jgi:phytanoyl-CoA hydroxylase
VDRGLSSQQQSRFREDGFLVLPEFADAAACVALRKRALELARSHVPAPARATVFTADGDARHAAERYFLTSGEAIRCFFEKDAFDPEGGLRGEAHLSLNKLGHALHDLDPVFDAFSRTPALAAVARDAGLEVPLLLQSMYIFKQPRIGGEVVCHTDHTYLWTDPPSATGFWFAIDDATTENGCLWALPGGHRLPAKSRSRLNAARNATELEVFDAAPYPREGLVPIEARRGTLVLLHGLLPHLSGPNRSDLPRHAYTLHAIDARARYPEDNWLQRPTLPLRGFA